MAQRWTGRMTVINEVTMPVILVLIFLTPCLACLVATVLFASSLALLILLLVLATRLLILAMPMDKATGIQWRTRFAVITALVVEIIIV